MIGEAVTEATSPKKALGTEGGDSAETMLSDGLEVRGVEIASTASATKVRLRSNKPDSRPQKKPAEAKASRSAISPDWDAIPSVIEAAIRQSNQGLLRSLGLEFLDEIGARERSRTALEAYFAIYQLFIMPGGTFHDKSFLRPLTKLNKKLVAGFRSSRAFKRSSPDTKSYLEVFWSTTKAKHRSETKNLAYSGAVKSLEGLIVTLEGLSEVPIARDFAGALSKVAAQANPDDALALLGEQLRAFEPPILHDSGQQLPTVLPETAPKIYTGRSGVKSSDFLATHWQPYLDARLLNQHHLRKLDPGLMTALSNEFRGRRDALRQLLPTKRQEGDALLAAAGITVTPHTRNRKLAALRRAKDPPVQP